MRIAFVVLLLLWLCAQVFGAGHRGHRRGWRKPMADSSDEDDAYYPSW